MDEAAFEKKNFTRPADTASSAGPPPAYVVDFGVGREPKHL
jgi:hypothetical protein